MRQMRRAGATQSLRSRHALVGGSRGTLLLVGALLLLLQAPCGAWMVQPEGK